MSEYVPDQRLKQFWEENVFFLFQKLISGTYPLQEIQARYASNCAEIAKRFGSELHVCLSDSKPTAGTIAVVPLMGYELIKNSVPQITIFIQSVAELFDDEKATGLADFRQAFEARVVIGYLHELDHLAKGLVGSRNDPIDTQLHNEVLAHAETCEYTILPMIEVHHLRLSREMQLRYSQWLAAGRNAKSPVWTTFISSMYRHLLETRK